MQVCVIGMGYVGLVTGACLAQIGHHVTGVDNDPHKLSLLAQGQVPIYEPGLDRLIQTQVASGRLQFTQDLRHAVLHSQIIFIAVGTPALPSGESDTRAVEAVAGAIGQTLAEELLSHQGPRPYRVVVNKSTVPIGAGDWVRMLVLDGMEHTQHPTLTEGDLATCFDVVSNPEFLREGTAIEDTFWPDRIVLGFGSTAPNRDPLPTALTWMNQLYQPIIDRQIPDYPNRAGDPVPVVMTDLNSAEMIKYAANAFLATKISFINEIANIAERVGADIRQVAHGIGLDHRIGQSFLGAGLGWGGSCFPKDLSALIHIAADYDYTALLLKSVIDINQGQRQRLVKKLQDQLKVLKGKTIGLLGLAFKPNTNDLRDAPALAIAATLHRLGARVKASDPVINQLPSHVTTPIKVVRDPYALAKGCDALVLVTEWQEFRTLDYGKLFAVMGNPVFVDGRNILDGSKLESFGFTYIGMG
ncbi:MAG: UDP-glucose/GDP-mannose dehydrogenase family protein [Synechococcales cyanobacterium]